MDARSALFDLYGDHLRARGGHAPVASLVRLLAPLGVQPPAVRTAVSRMVRQGWLSPQRLASGPGYALTPRAVRRLDEAAERIYRTAVRPWDGTWHLLTVEPPRARRERDRLHAQLRYLGYAAVAPQTWLAPRRSPELDAVLEDDGGRHHAFDARLSRGTPDAAAMVAAAWDLEGLGAAYEAFLDGADALLGAPVEALLDTPEEAFAARSRLVHTWRKFLFVDPGLPAELLPPDWPGTAAAAWFDAQAAALLPAARRFVSTCLPAGDPTPPVPIEVPS